ncbi:MAG TPA: phosphatase PAP2 family protein [Casimicrobiaceae bacterium]
MVTGVLLLTGTATATAGGGPLGIDHEIGFDDSGIWARHSQLALEYGVIAVEAGGALILGANDPLGRTFWQTIDASVASGIVAQAAKYAFGRERPGAGNDPNAWFRGRCCHSFPSGEVTLQAAFVTPIIVNYQAQHPWVWALEALPVYDAVARMKVHAHWQTDVLAGFALGSGFGILATRRETPFFVSILPSGVTAGIHASF